MTAAVDFARVCVDLRRTFGSLRQVARLVQFRNPDYLGKLARAEVAEPKYSLGASLLELYRKHVGEELPMLGAPQQRRLI